MTYKAPTRWRGGADGGEEETLLSSRIKISEIFRGALIIWDKLGGFHLLSFGHRWRTGLPDRSVSLHEQNFQNPPRSCRNQKTFAATREREKRRKERQGVTGFSRLILGRKTGSFSWCAGL